ncbi:glutaminyl-tRNA synthetase [Plasmodium inui San Antonio 1]|uniref:glutamine--tRNA ligase n=1 Tax=Plasmodium inui San Antonio 1 TaxID=1237626 RepID=W7AF31_9APIC|nr:glutaminyl-tRNA synthetase [Plasmodium inui San Antonio 1]EUD67629.1 glutaminyl-tRNA synthetase [Plasmodium inui San Antonio 1]
MENVEKIYIRNKADLSDNFFYFYNWVKLNFNTCLIISENSSLRSSVVLELLNGKRLVLSEINVCEALFRLTCGGVGDAVGDAISNPVRNPIRDHLAAHCRDSLRGEELKFYLKGQLASDKPVDEEFLQRVEAEMALQKVFCREKLSFVDFLLFSIFKKAKVERLEDPEGRYPHVSAWLSQNNFTIKEEDMTSFASTNFIQQIIEDDLKRKKHTCVITRFPPEPNGYLHLGHAKSICLNFGLSEKYGGRTHLRFDDTNPVTEEVRYIESIKEDVKWLGFDWKEHLYFASDYFDQLYEWAIQLIKQGDAYVDDQSIEEIRKNRGSLKQPGVNSPYRERSIEDNLTLFRKMKLGEFAEGEKVLRAKIDMSSGNINLRDPILYRIMHKTHPKSGDKWVIYPMYDFAHGQSDSIERITHSICTVEFETHRPLYDWFQEKLGIYRTRQIEFARLNVTYMVMSKRKLLTLVNEKYVDGWDDPRMPTISGMRRRGYSPEAIKDFCAKVGVAKRENIISYELLELCAREDMNKKSKRLFAILKPLKVVITNFVPNDEKLHELTALNHPKNESMGQRTLKFEQEIYIDEEDFHENPPDHFYRLAPNRTVRLRYAFYITCQEVVRDEATNRIVELRCTYDPESKSRGNVSQGGVTAMQSGATASQSCAESLKKIKSTIHWVAKSNAQNAQFRIYDKLFTKPNPESNEDDEDVEKLMENYTVQLDRQNSCPEEEEAEEEKTPPEQQSELEGKDNLGWRKYINKNSLQIHQGIVEKYASSCSVGEAIQFERIGFFTKDKDSTEDCPVFNLTVALVENSALKKKEDLVKKELDRLKREKAASERRLKREERKLREQRKLEQAAGGKGDASEVSGVNGVE